MRAAVARERQTDDLEHRSWPGTHQESAAMRKPYTEKTDGRTSSVCMDVSYTSMKHPVTKIAITAVRAVCNRRQHAHGT
eukprot:SAG31_NODE_6443_length_2015_cov_7.837161_2_plen_79_part_00